MLTQTNVNQRLAFVRMVLALAAILGVDELLSRLFFTDQSTIDLASAPHGRTEVVLLISSMFRFQYCH